MDVAINLLRECNIDCPHCFIKRKGPQIYIERIKEAVNVSQPREITFSGGEPFLRQDILDILSYIDSKGCSINVYTNGYLIMDKHIEILRKIRGLIVYVSDHSEYEGTPYLHERVYSVMKKLTDNGIKVGINKLLTISVFDKLDEFLDRIAFADRVMFQYPTPVGIANVSIIGPEVWCKMTNELEAQAKKRGKLRIFYEPAFAKSEENWSNLVCVSGNDIYMDSNGKSYPCCISVDILEGSDDIKPIRVEPSRCKDCGGGCPVLNKMHGHDPRCNNKGYIPVCPVIVKEAMKKTSANFPSKIDSYEIN